MRTPDKLVVLPVVVGAALAPNAGCAENPVEQCLAIVRAELLEDYAVQCADPDTALPEGREERCFLVGYEEGEALAETYATCEDGKARVLVGQVVGRDVCDALFDNESKETMRVDTFLDRCTLFNQPE